MSEPATKPPRADDIRRWAASSRRLFDSPTGRQRQPYQRRTGSLPAFQALTGAKIALPPTLRGLPSGMGGLDAGRRALAGHSAPRFFVKRHYGSGLVGI